MKTPKLNYFVPIYFILFLAYFLLWVLVFYAPIWIALLTGMIITFVGSWIIANKLENDIKEQNPLYWASQLNKTLLITIFPPNRIKFYIAEKDISENSIRIRILKDGRFEKYKFYLSPEQEFSAEVLPFKWEPVGEKEKEKILPNNPEELFNNPMYWVELELKEPLKQIWKIDGYNMDAVIFVYPTEILDKTQLKVWKLSYNNTEVKEEKRIVMEEGIPRETIYRIEIPVYSPKPYTISTDSIKEISAVHRFSQISTILENTKKMLERSEGIVSGFIPAGVGGFGGIFNIFRNRNLMIAIILIVGFLFMLIIVNMIMAGMTGALTKVAEAGLTKLATANTTNITKFP